MADRANPRFERALLHAMRAHRRVQQARKGTDVPRVVHPIRVAEILDAHGHDEPVVVAGFLHDLIEDADDPLLRSLDAEARALFADDGEAAAPGKPAASDDPGPGGGRR